MILKALKRAYEIKEQRGWDRIYWAIDLHGVCLKSNYETGGYEFINLQTVQALRHIASLPESVIILWSSVHDAEKADIVKFFEDNGINVFGFNGNPLEQNTTTGCFDEKFYFSILLDDKAGFDPSTDWYLVDQWLTLNKQSNVEQIYE